MPFSWTPEAERLLLLCTVKAEDLKPKADIWQSISDQLGGQANANACSQKFYKLKREAEAMLANAGGAAPATPDTKKTTKTPGSKATGSRKRTKKQVDVDNEEDDQAVSESPTKAKKAKKEPKKEELVVKDEEAEAGADEKVEKATFDQDGIQD